MKITYTEKLLQTLEKKIEESKNWEEESKFRLLQSGACSMLAAIIMDNKRDKNANNE